LLKAQNISVSYGGRPALAGVDLDVRSGRVVVIIGPNGAGKSTLLRVLNGTVQPSTGTVVLDGEAMDRLSRRQIAERIAVVAQENETKFPVTVAEFVLAGRFVRGGAFGWETEADFDAMLRALADCDLEELTVRAMNALSGGERQRVVLARAFASGADILLFDEPTANLDLAHQALMFSLVRRRCRDERAAAVVIIHDLNLAAEFADEIVLIAGGRTVARGRPSEVLTREHLTEVFGVEMLLDQNPASGKVRVTTVY
jgi:iron complex transport system ATP-binding protein